MSAQPASLPPFILAEGESILQAQGTLEVLGDEAEALALARQKGSGVVGLIPFDPDQEPLLGVSDQLIRYQAPAARDLSALFPAPSALEGVDNEGYRQAVSQALVLLAGGRLEKVVLGRLLKVYYEQELDLPSLYETLRAQQPSAQVFSFRLPQGRTLMGASPELVLASDAQGFRTKPLAGSSSRQALPGSMEDLKGAEALLASAKDRAEHATVVEDICRRLGPLTSELLVPAQPELVSTPQLWHLGTPMSGRLKAGISSLAAARAIHPTPAICGTPTDLARQVIADLEPFERSYFGGLVGYMDTQGYGSWYLVLRCAELEGPRATLFAGAGIVQGSQPASEHEETASKLGTFARALGLNLSAQV